MMLDHCGPHKSATRLRVAIHATLNLDNVRTGDLGGSANTATFTKTLIGRINNG